MVELGVACARVGHERDEQVHEEYNGEELVDPEHCRGEDGRGQLVADCDRIGGACGVGVGIGVAAQQAEEVVEAA